MELMQLTKEQKAVCGGISRYFEDIPRMLITQRIGQARTDIRLKAPNLNFGFNGASGCCGYCAGTHLSVFFNVRNEDGYFDYRCGVRAWARSMNLLENYPVTPFNDSYWDWMSLLLKNAGSGKNRPFGPSPWDVHPAKVFKRLSE